MPRFALELENVDLVVVVVVEEEVVLRSVVVKRNETGLCSCVVHVLLENCNAAVVHFIPFFQ